MKKKILAFLLAAIMVVGMIPMTVFAEGTEPTYVAQVTDKDGNFVGQYETLEDAIFAAKDGDTIKLLGDVFVPETIDFYDSNFGYDSSKPNRTIKSEGMYSFVKKDGTFTLDTLYMAVSLIIILVILLTKKLIISLSLMVFLKRAMQVLFLLIAL